MQFSREPHTNQKISMVIKFNTKMIDDTMVPQWNPHLLRLSRVLARRASAIAKGSEDLRKIS